MANHSTLFENVRKRTGMYVGEERYETVAAYVAGYDAACEGGVLAGFREWLVVRVGMGDNLAWPALVLNVAFPQAAIPEEELARSPANERHAIDTMFDLIAEFDQVRWKFDGLREIFLAYEAWQRSEKEDDSDDDDTDEDQ